MAFIRIKSLTASGPDVETSTIIFGKKLTIIAGPSDTGKTCIYKCIDYIFGGNNDPSNLPFDEVDKYTTICLELETHKGLIELSREQKSNSTMVTSHISEIESGEYVLKESRKNTKTINSLFLKLIDAPNDLKLPKNDKGQTASFTWRTIKNSFMINEHRADTNESILIDVQNQPLYLASLIYLISGNELNEYKGDKEAEIILHSCPEMRRKAFIIYPDLLVPLSGPFVSVVEYRVDIPDIDSPSACYRGKIPFDAVGIVRPQPYRIFFLLLVCSMEIH